jgi:hypothetical protein
VASIIRVKRSPTTGSPTALAQGEVAYSYLAGTDVNGGDRLYIGTGVETGGEAANIEVIGGKYFTTKLDHTPGTLTANSAIITDAANKIDVLNVDNITINGNAITSTNTNGNITLNPNGTGVIDASTSQIINVTDPSAPQHAATKSYVDAQVIAASNGSFTFIGDTGSDSVPIGATTTFTGGTGISTVVTDGFVSIAIDNTTVTAGSYGSSTQIPTFTVDAQGRLTAAGTASISTDLSIAGDTGTDVVPSGQTLTFVGGTNITSVVANNQVNFSLDSAVSGLTSLAVDNITINGNVISSTDTNGSITLTPNGTGSVIISSNLIINGTTTTVNSNEVNIGDAIILLNSDEVGVPSQNGGIEIERGTSANKSLIWDETADKWTIGAETFVATTFEGALTGNATTATAWATGRTITLTGDVTGVSAAFSGSGNLSFATTIAPNSVALGTDTTGSYVAQGATSGNGLSGAVNIETGTFTVSSNATNLNTASTLVFRDASGDFSAGTITAALTGNASTATNVAATGVTAGNLISTVLPFTTASATASAFKVPFLNTTTSVSGNYGLLLDADGLTYNPSTNVLTATTFAGNATTATAWATGRTITLTGDVTGVSASFNGSGNLSFATTIAPNSVALGTDTTGDYVASVGVTASTGLSVTGTGEGAGVVLAGIDATTTVKGVASFATANFTVTSGAVAITAVDGGTF